MSRDYKNVKNKNKEPSPVVGNLLSFFTGLALGLFIAFLVVIQYGYLIPGTKEKEPVVTSPANKQVAESDEPAPDKGKSVPPPTFDFYKILPNKEINISEWVAEDKQELVPDEEQDNGIYILQVGSFQDYDSADQVKATLALLGIDADIQRVVINGQDIRHRVRVGPFEDTGKLMNIRKKLEDNNLSFMLLKLKAEEIQ